MFQEDVQAIAAAEKAASVTSGDYEAVITGATMQKGREPGKAGFFVITHTISEGEFEGCEYPQFLSLSPAAAGVRSSFYRNIGYVRPEDGGIDENDFIGRNTKLTLVNTDSVVKIVRVSKSDRESEDSPATDDFAV